MNHFRARDFHRPAIVALLAGVVLGFTGCEKIRSKLDRLASAANPKTTEMEQVPLTPEEERMNKLLQDPKLFEATAAAEPEVPKASAFELNKSSVVSVLGYHDFRERGGDAMMINATKFREQMQAIKDSKIPVIRMSDLLAWKRGEKNIPEEAIVITMDDGWQGVHRFAFPVLKEFGFPFTVYLYKKYVNIGGRSLTWNEIREMMAAGAEVGSHSVSHENMTSKHGRSDADHQLWILTELKDSKEFLEKTLGLPCTSFAFPYGNHNDALVETAHQIGYEAMVTVNGQKVTWETPAGKLGRYIIHGDNDANFRLATNFRGRGDLANANVIPLDAKDEAGNALIDFTPAPDQVVTQRRPLIQLNLIRLGSIVPDSIRMKISGFGVVPAQFDPATFKLTYQVPYKLRQEECFVTVHFKRNETAPDEMVTWKFKVNLAASYLPKNDELPLAQPQAVPVAQ
jgi:peptidoglycan/xylan/chitin deacetylase (PgdA/CDA1 family)